VSENGYATLGDLESLAGFRQYRDVIVTHPVAGKPLLKFRLQSITEAEWSEIGSSNFDVKRGGLSEQGLQTSDARLVAMSLVDGDGNLLMRGKGALDKIRSLCAGIVEPLVRACRELNNLRSGEDPEKNSQDGSDSDTSSAESTLPVESATA